MVLLFLRSLKYRWFEYVLGAVVVAVGGTGMTVFVMLVVRAAVVGFLGGLAGYVAGACIALGQDFGPALGVVFSWRLFGAVLGGTVAASVVGASSASLSCAFIQHVKVLQE